VDYQIIDPEKAYLKGNDYNAKIIAETQKIMKVEIGRHKYSELKF
jgi:hypothetical protein